MPTEYLDGQNHPPFGIDQVAGLEEALASDAGGGLPDGIGAETGAWTTAALSRAIAMEPDRLFLFTADKPVGMIFRSDTRCFEIVYSPTNDDASDAFTVMQFNVDNGTLSFPADGGAWPISFNGLLGFFGSNPGSQPPAPTTLEDVIAGLQSLGLFGT